MMNLRNLGSQESLGVKYIDGMCAKYCWKLWFENDWYFCNITESLWFLMGSRNKFPITSYSQFRRSRTQMFVKIGVLKNLTQLFCREYCKFFKNSVYIENLRWLLFFQFDKVTVQHWASADFLFLIKNTMWDGFY